MKFDILIPSSVNDTNLTNILRCIDFQSVLPEKIYLALDKKLDRDEFEYINYIIYKNIKNKHIRENIVLLSNITSDFRAGRGVSYIRNYLLDKSKSEFVYFLDDDNQFESDFFERSIELYDQIKSEINKDFIFSPKIIYRKTGKSQSEGIADFNFALSKVRLNQLGDKKYSIIKMIGGNSLFGPRYVFDQIRFDEDFEFVYEDLDMSYRSYLSGYPIVVSNELGINHMERDKTRAEHSFVGKPEYAYQKSRNRMFFVMKNADANQKFIFLWFGLWVQTAWFFVLVMMFGHQKWQTMKAIVHGIRDGLKYKKLMKIGQKHEN